MKEFLGIALVASLPTTTAAQSTFFAPVEIVASTSISPLGTRLELVDFNGDNREDLIEVGGYVALAHLGGLSGWQIYGFPYPPLAHADFDRDGRVDLLSDGGVVFQFDSSLNRFTSSNTQLIRPQNAIQAIATSDFNGDGWTDIALNEGGAVAIWFNFGGSFPAPVILEASASLNELFAADLDNDSDIDLLGIGSQEYVWTNQGAGFYGSASRSNRVNSGYHHLRDVDGDGLADLLHATSFRIEWRKNLGGSFTPAPSTLVDFGAYSAPTTKFALIDVDSDGDQDCVFFLLAPYQRTLAWAENLGSANFSAPQLLVWPSAGFNLQDLIFGIDADADGDEDLGVLSAARTISLAENLGAGPPSSVHQVGLGCGSGPMSLNPSATASVGGTFAATIQSTPSPMCSVIFGFSNTIGPGGTSLPVDLSGIGMTGCSLYQSFDIVLATRQGAAAFERTLFAPIPPDGRILGTHVYTQAFTLSYGANALGIVMSNGLDWLIGGS